jgi:hypothetical protein
MHDHNRSREKNIGFVAFLNIALHSSSSLAESSRTVSRFYPTLCTISVTASFLRQRGLPRKKRNDHRIQGARSDINAYRRLHLFSAPPS